MTTIHGFVRTNTRELPEIRAALHEYIHEGTRARLCWLERSDENKTFCIAFRTPAFDDTGVFHILEHSVLCGSERYPVKEPFVELMKGSVNTFLNALTYPDRTCYPVSSRNDRDFLNLTRVYLDAVFFPSIYQKREIFEQEGHHISFAEGTPARQGVVLNEMRGAFADPDTILLHAISKGLFPDTTYRFVSGGAPASIPTLTYEAFLATHRRFYHPSNAWLMLDGAIEPEETFALLDSYLSRFRAIEPDTAISLQQPVKQPMTVHRYALGEDESPETKTRLGFGFVLGTFRDKKKMIAAQILNDVLCGSTQAPLCRPILERELAENVSLSNMEEEQQPWMLLEVENLRQEDAETVRCILFDTLRALCRDGLDHSQVEASLAALEFRMRERDYGTMPRGLVFIMDMLSSAIYGGDPADRLEFGTLFEELREDLKNGYFERLLGEIFLNNPHTAETMLLPSKTEAEERRKQEAVRLQAYLDARSEEEKTALAEQERALLAAQQQPDSKEALATIPHIRVSDLPEEPVSIPSELQTLSGLQTLTHDVDSDGILYATLYFAADDLTEAEIPYASLLCSLMCQLPTETMDLLELQKQMRLQLGGASVGLTAYSRMDLLPARIYVNCSASMLRDNLKNGAELTARILRQTQFSDEKLILTLVRQMRESLQQQILASGSSFALLRVSACAKPDSVFSELTRGISFFQFLCELERSFSACFSALREMLCSLADRLFTTKRMMLSVTGDAAPAAGELAAMFTDLLPEGEACGSTLVLQPFGARKEGIVIPSDVSFAAIGADLPDGAFTGQLRVACRVASIGHLWNEVRVQNGAYGAGMSVRDNGTLTAYSYRDPSAKTSLQAIGRTGGYLRSIADTSLEPYIIGAISDAEPLLSPSLMGTIADLWYLKGMTPQLRRRLRREMLSFESDDLEPCADLIDACMQNGSVCVLGPEQQLSACSDLTRMSLTKNS